MFILIRIILIICIFVAVPARGELLLFQNYNLVLDTTYDLMWLNYPKAARPWDTQTSNAAASTDQGFTDWRLATSTELLYLQDTDNLPQLDSKFQLGPVRNWSLWSSSSASDGSFVLSTRYYVVSFLDSSTFGASSLQYYPTLFVRDVPDYYITDSDSRYLIDSNGDFIISGD